MEETDIELMIAIQTGQKDQFHIVLPPVDRFIRSDLKAGGTGGPLFPVFLEARTRKLDKPLGVVLLRGITTVTAIGSVGELQSFDAGIGILLLDRWILCILMVSLIDKSPSGGYNMGVIRKPTSPIKKQRSIIL